MLYDKIYEWQLNKSWLRVICALGPHFHPAALIQNLKAFMRVPVIFDLYSEVLGLQLAASLV